MRLPRLFVDANIIFSAVKSSQGGSAKLFELAKTGKVAIITSSLALYEARKNIALKLSPKKLLDFYLLLKVDFSTRNVDKKEAIKKYGKIIIEKDAPILAAALETKVDFLITLDRKHFMTTKIKKAKLPIKILTPKDFLQKYS